MDNKSDPSVFKHVAPLKVSGYAFLASRSSSAPKPRVLHLWPPIDSIGGFPSLILFSGLIQKLPCYIHRDIASVMEHYLVLVVPELFLGHDQGAFNAGRRAQPTNSSRNPFARPSV